MAQHFSFRVPWHDNGWNGTVCNNPSENYACMRLKGINQGRDEALENEHATCKFCKLDCVNNMPCIREGGTFMSDDDISVTVTHPYSTWSENHKHLLPLTETIPAYSYPARPFRWVMRQRNIGNGQYKYIDELAAERGFEFHAEYEPKMKNKTWVQDGRNQEAVFNAFFDGTVENESLCVFYAKQVPFVEDARRVVIGIGHIQKVTSPIKYGMSNPNGMTSCAWENMVKHSIRPDMKDGFLLPYSELMDYASKHNDFDVTKGVVFASEDYFNEFSYASEQLSHDAVIDVILQCLKAVEVYKDCKLKGNWENIIVWLNEQLSCVWEDRGAFPGLGSVLTAFGIPSGPVVARELKEKCNDMEIWEVLDDAIEEPSKYLSDICASQINDVIRDTWKNLSKERKMYIQLISRISLSIDQAKAIYATEQRDNLGLSFTDHDIIENPYLLYEKTREKADIYRISIKKVDLAFYPSEFIAKKYPIQKPSAMNSAIDKRRVRAIAVAMLEQAAINGNTLMPVKNMILAIAGLTIEPRCPITSDMMAGMNGFFLDEIEIKKDAFGKDYYKLIRYKKLDHLIATQIKKRVQSPNRHKINVDWLNRVNTECDKFSRNPNEEVEKNAREEKAATLKVLAEARLSVLIGGAGTGKTTVLEILCKEPEIQNGGILLLAPTGKARVRMSQGLRGKVEFKAKTIAQFLLMSGRYDTDTGSYKILTPAERHNVRSASVPKTVIIDESSMLTEDMFGALLDAVSDAERLIFVGDYNQLPPIGAGRPFVDVVRYIRTVDKIANFPMVGKNFAKLTVTNRQLPDATTNKVRSDVRLARWYTDDGEDRDEDIFAEIQGGAPDKKVVFKQWHDKDELEKILCETIAEITEMDDADDIDGFNRSFGGKPHHGDKYDGLTFFNYTKVPYVGCASRAEDWQILSPVRNDSHGVLHMNHFIHEKYRRESMELAEAETGNIPKRMGADGIVYGDKVINVTNQRRNAWPKEEAYNYVANGEIGIASGGWGQENYLKVEYASQIGYVYSYVEKDDFGDEGTDPLELAYALTVHKSQGSQFTTVIVVLSDKCFLMSKELLYTALTRQKDQLIILYDQEAYNLKRYSSMEYSDIAQRYTDLFETPRIVEVNQKYFEENLIHRTKNGIMVRSKSEVIIANMLCDNGFEDFLYEEKLPLGNTYKLPDFTFKDAASGAYIIWEHLGMLGNAEYKAAWEEKRRIYAANGFTEENGNLIVTMDSLDGGIDSMVIQQKIDDYLM
jgi:hypothetical protein